MGDCTVNHSEAARSYYAQHPRPFRTDTERFWQKVIRHDGCWGWAGSVGSTGYAQMGSRKGEGVWRSMKASRFSFELHVGPIPDGMCVCHSCDNPICVNPEHLFLGTQLDNMKDKVKKGRHRNQHTGAAHCKNGHPWTPESTGIQSSGRGRKCLACTKERSARYYRELRADPERLAAHRVRTNELERRHRALVRAIAAASKRKAA